MRYADTSFFQLLVLLLLALLPKLLLLLLLLLLVSSAISCLLIDLFGQVRLAIIRTFQSRFVAVRFNTCLRHTNLMSAQLLSR